jgi:hypothetical protein
MDIATIFSGGLAGALVGATEVVGEGILSQSVKDPYDRAMLQIGFMGLNSLVAEGMSGDWEGQSTQTPDTIVGGTCAAQRILDAIPGAQLTGGETAQGGHEQFNIQVSSSDLSAAGFTPYTTIFGTPNGYHDGSLFSQVHVNGQNGTQLPGSDGVLNAQGHIDIFNPAAGYGVGLVLHSVWDLGVGSLFFPHSAALDPGCSQ